jgi:hypothetical protein
MQRLLQLSILVLFIFGATLARAEETPKFISKILPPIPVVMTEAGGVKVSYITGTVDEQNSFSLCFENKTDKAINFTWTLTNKNGDVLGSSMMVLAPNSRIDYSNSGDFTELMIYTVDDNSNPANCKITLEF